MSRRIAISGSMRVVDHETFGANEIGVFPFTDDKILDDEQLEQILYTEGKVGGEVRVELTLNAQLLNSNNIRLTGTALMYEGTSEDSGDLDGRSNFSFVVPVNRRVRHRVYLRNTDEGGDFADISFTSANLLG